MDKPPLDHEPVYRGPHPIRKGLLAAWAIIGAAGAVIIAAAFAPFVIMCGAAALAWWGVLLCLTPKT